MKLIHLLAIFIFVATPILAADPQKAIEDTRTILEKWVEQRKEIADRKASWIVEKQSLGQSIGLYQREIEELNHQIKDAQEQSSAADKEYVALEDKEKLLIEATKAVDKVIDGLEAQLIKLMKVFPEPLKVKTAEFARRIPTENNRKDKSLSERVQNLVAILGEVDKFNSLVSSDTEIRKTNGKEIEVDTLYLGLGQAYFVTKDSRYAGVGYPGNEQWEWVDKPELASRIREALAMLLNVKPAEFVGLEVTVK